MYGVCRTTSYKHKPFSFFSRSAHNILLKIQQDHLHVNIKSNYFKASTTLVDLYRSSQEIMLNSQENTCARASFLTKLLAIGHRLASVNSCEFVLSCEFCEISKNIFFTECLRVTASAFGAERYHIVNLNLKLNSLQLGLIKIIR